MGDASLHIVHLSTRMDYYGGEVCLANLARGCIERGHRVSCLVRWGSALAEKMSGGAVDVIPMRIVDWFDPSTLHRIGGWLRSHDVDVLATHLPRDYFIASVASRGLSLTNVATRHRLQPLAFPLVKRPFLRGFGAVVGVSEAVSRGLRQARLVPSERIVTVPNGVATPRHYTGPGLRERCGIPVSAPVVGLVGRLQPDKGVDFLVAAVGKLVRDWPGLHVMLVGDGGLVDGYCDLLRQTARQAHWQERLHFLGYVPHAATHSSEFDVQVIASPAEPFGLATIEAMASGVPVIVTDAGGSPEIVRDGVEGFLVPPGDVEVLANRLVCLLGSRGLRREMGARGRRRCQKHYTVDHMVAATERVYQQAVAWKNGQ